MKNLESLDLSSNQLKEIKFLADIKKLKTLDLHSNQISDVGFLMDVARVGSIDLSNNQILSLPESILSLNADILWEKDEYYFFHKNSENFLARQFYFFNNPIISPPVEIIKDGNEAIKAWFSQADKYGIEKVYEAKILIVGEPNAGKTSLINKVLDENYPIPGKEKEKSTLGVEVRKTDKFKYSKDPTIKITSNFWDFGGQDIQYALHQYFITSEALYILVSDYRSETTRFSYWFNTINLLGSKQSRVIVLLNKFKDVTSSTSFDIASYRRDFPDLNIELIEVDLSENDARWLALKELIQRKLEELPVVGQDSIRIYKSIREEIENKIKAGIHYLTLQELCKLSEDVGMQSENDTMIMLDYFHKIGLVIYFPDDTSLQNDVFLNPNWITRAIYDALSDTNLEHINGQFKKEWIFDFWKNKNYKEYEFVKLLNLMQRDHFDLCYPLPSNKNNYIVPLLLPDRIPFYTWNKTKNLQLRYIYEQFMPEGIMSQFIVRMHEYITLADTNQSVWKKGVILERKNTKAEIIEHTNGREIRVRLFGENINELKGMIMDNFDNIVSRFPKQPDIKIPCNCSTCEKLEEPHFFFYSNLSERKAKGIKSAGECENSYESIKISDILEEYEIPISEREKVVMDYLSAKDGQKFIEGFHTLIIRQYAARFFKNANESTYHALLFDWLRQFSSVDNFDIQIEVNSPNGEIDLLVRSFPNAKVPIVIKDIFEFKYISKKSTDTQFEKELADARKQANNYRVGEYQNYRTISVVFRGNKDFKIAID
ncbi:MAG TPA: COR domain-containing protein [Leptospiraceae bacterium]|nr:COR domain-containing protein [Leptospiraceae bacterium]